MSTHACIARPGPGGGIIGTYHHFDGYPSALGAWLSLLLDHAFNGDLDAMTNYLVDGERVGWSTIILRDFNQPKCWPAYAATLTGPVSYTARGDRTEYRALDTDATEFTYVLLPEGVACYRRGSHLGLIRWGHPHDAVALDPDGDAAPVPRMLAWVSALQAA